MVVTAAAVAIAATFICIDKMRRKKSTRKILNCRDRRNAKRHNQRDEPRVICFLCLHFSSLPKNLPMDVMKTRVQTINSIQYTSKKNKSVEK